MQFNDLRSQNRARFGGFGQKYPDAVFESAAWFFGLRFLRLGFVVARGSQARGALGRTRFTMAMPTHAATQKQRLKEEATDSHRPSSRISSSSVILWCAAMLLRMLDSVPVRIGLWWGMTS